MADRSVELASAIYSALAGNVGLTALIGSSKVYDTPPAGVASPYVVIGEETAIDAGTSLIDAQEHTLTIHVWSEQTSTLQCKQVMSAVRAALHGVVLTLSAGTCANLRQELKELYRDPDGWLHGVLRFRAVTHD